MLLPIVVIICVTGKKADCQCSEPAMHATTMLKHWCH